MANSWRGALVLVCLVALSPGLASNVRANETVTYTYDALGRLVASSSSGTVNNGQSVSTNFDPAGNRTNYSVTGVASTSVATISIANASATEGGVLSFTVSRSGITTTAASASYATADGTAVSGSDFTAGSGTVSFAAGETSKTITVATLDDTAPESTETMSIMLSNPSSSAAIAAATGSGTITDNDTAATSTLAVSDASALEGYVLTFLVTRSGSNTGTTSVNYATAIGTAGTGDFVSASGTLTFGPGETSKVVNVAAKTDIRAEFDESFYLNLSGPTNGAGITDAQGIGTIYDDGTGGCRTC